MNNILLTGCTDLIGQYFIEKFLNLRYNVSILSLEEVDSELVKVIKYDPKAEFIPEEAFKGINHIIHLAGVSIMSKRWTAYQKKKIINSRINLMVQLHDSILKYGCKIESFTTASKINIYPYDDFKIFKEKDLKGDNFLSQACKKWEETAYDYFKLHLGIRTSCIRSSMVLSLEGGFKKIVDKLPFTLQIGSGNQPVSWIHIEDLFGVYQHIIHHQLEGDFNASSSDIVTYHEFVTSLANARGKKHYFKRIPRFILKLFFGKRHEVLSKGLKVSSEKIIDTGYVFKHPNLDDTLQIVFNKKQLENKIP